MSTTENSTPCYKCPHADSGSCELMENEERCIVLDEEAS
jgi:hypothetical protein